MAKIISPERKQLMEQVLEYWYTVDFLNQGALQTEITRRDKENYAFAMAHPKQFGSLYRHEFLLPGENIMDKIEDLEQVIEDKRQKEDADKQNARSMPPCCHGRITVYVGSLSRAYLSERIADLLRCEPPSNPSADRLALASFQLDDEGKYIRGSVSISPIVWAVKRILEKKPSMTMYEVLDPDQFKADHTAFEPDDQDPYVSYEKISELAVKLLSDTVEPICANIEDTEALTDIHYCFSVYRNRDERSKRETDDYYSLAMSFYADDLAGFKKAVETEKWADNAMWSTLIDYICAPYDMAHGVERARKDLSIAALREPSAADKTKALLSDALSIDRTPWGKWPSKHQPFFMQQAAINLAVSTDQPVFAVNGPPGTGKTTLLKEIVADNVVRKALIMSAYEDPDQMFCSNELMIGSTRHYYYSFCPQAADIRKLAIVVASSNNAAIENISKQLPLSEPLEKNLRDTGNTVIESIRKLFSIEHARVETVTRKNFEKEGQPNEPVSIPDIYFSSYAADLLRDQCWGLISVPLGKRSNIVSFYKKVLKQLYWDFYKQSSFCRNRVADYQDARKRFLEQYEAVKALRRKLANAVDKAERSGAPSVGEDDEFAVCLSDELFGDLSSQDPDIRKRAQMSCPRISRQYDREREKLFHAALLLTKEFVLSSECCRNNFSLLGMAWDLESYGNIFAGMNPEDKDKILKKCMTPIIQTLQLFVPVISTTFASAGRFFKYVNKLDALGTIVVDEAGQATPQMALRLFSKASRAIVVGDPNQIDPVVSDELAFLESTLDREIGDLYSDRTISVQKIADHLSVYGGTQRVTLGCESAKWIGIPLYVHSRCIEPMFSVSNRLAYGDAMLRITQEPSDDLTESFCCRTSRWINVYGLEEKKKNHFISSQGRRALDLLETAFSKNALKADENERNAGPDLFIISPFHTVAEEMRQLLANSLSGEYPALARDREIVENWLIDEQNPHIGTVHTFQGREANEVILLLGCDKNSENSARWVNRNIVNVAVSRAKYRLYAIGDSKVWDCCEPIAEMKQDLDTYAFKALAKQYHASDEACSIPVIPSFEMFDISEPDDSIEIVNEIELPIDTDAGIAVMRERIPELKNDLSPTQLMPFGIASMDDFVSRFSEGIQRLLKTGIWNYTWIRPKADALPEFFDASSVAVCFCKAFELSLKENFFPGLQALIPDTPVRGKTLADIDAASMMIGEYAMIITLKQSELGSIMSCLGYREYDSNRWGALLQKLRICKDCRNECCHPGKPYTWKQLEELIELLFADSVIEPCETVSVPTTVHGLLLENGFRSVMDTILADNDVGLHRVINARARCAAAQGSPEAERHKAKTPVYVTKFCEIFSRIRKCTVDGTGLIQTTVDVKRRNGPGKKMNMLYCQQCGRYYMNTAALPITVNLKDYDLIAVPAKDW